MLTQNLNNHIKPCRCDCLRLFFWAILADRIPQSLQVTYGHTGTGQRHHVPERREYLVQAVGDQQVTGPRVTVFHLVNHPFGEAQRFQQDGHVYATAGNEIKRAEPHG